MINNMYAIVNKAQLVAALGVGIDESEWWGTSGDNGLVVETAIGNVLTKEDDSLVVVKTADRVDDVRLPAGYPDGTIPIDALVDILDNEVITHTIYANKKYMKKVDGLYVECEAGDPDPSKVEPIQDVIDSWNPD